MQNPFATVSRRIGAFVLGSILIALCALVPDAAGGGKPSKGKPKPPPTSPVPVTLQELGGNLFSFTGLSNPPGVACASCHNPRKGYVGGATEINGIMPGSVTGRFGFRSPPTISYVVGFCPDGPPEYVEDLTAYVGRFFRDGRAPTPAAQISGPVFNPDEMNNLVHGLPSPELVVCKLQQNAKIAQQFRAVWGNEVFELPAQMVFDFMVEAIVAFEASPEVSPFTSKYDAWLIGRAKMTPSELNGLRLFSGPAQCSQCHGMSSDPANSPSLFTQFCYVDIGVPRNPNNPYYKETNRKSNPFGYNPLGQKFIDLGLGDYLYPAAGLPLGNRGEGSNGQGDYLGINGTFKVPTARNTGPQFHERYMHNGAFSSLKQVVHFYNTRNLTTHPGEVINFNNPKPYAHLRGKPLWPTPEWQYNLQNAAGLPASTSAQVGNLGLTDHEENDIVNFLLTLNDGFFQR